MFGAHLKPRCELLFPFLLMKIGQRLMLLPPLCGALRL